jgi:transcriptional regulator with XRE-family HTH domain
MDAIDTGRLFNDWREGNDDEETITQQELAFRAGVSVRTAHGWCQGETTPSVAQLRLLEKLRPGLVARLIPEAKQAEG